MEVAGLPTAAFLGLVEATVAADALAVPGRGAGVVAHQHCDATACCHCEADPRTQAVRLLSNLKEIAWTNAVETMSPKDVYCDQAVDVFKSYIRLTYGKSEVSYIFGDGIDLDTDVKERQRKKSRGGHDGGRTNWMAGAPRVSAHTSEDVAAF